MSDLGVHSPPPATTAADQNSDHLAPPHIRWAWWRSRNHRSRLRTRPLLTPAPRGRLRLPGLRVETSLVETADPYRRPCGLVLVPDTGHVSMTLGVRLPDHIVDAAPAVGDLKTWLDAAATWLAQLADEPGLAGCALMLRQAPERPVGRQVLVQPTWHIAGLGATSNRLVAPKGRTDPAAQTVEVVARLPEIVRSLHQSGLGTARPLPADELTAVVATASDPWHADSSSDPWHASSLQAPDSDDVPKTRCLQWGKAGPDEHTERWDRFQHCGTVSVTWSMSGETPEMLLPSIERLMTHAPGNGLVRVTLLHAHGQKNAGPKLSALVTATSRGQGDESPGAWVPETLSASSRPWLRRLYGAQAAGFAAGLPTGILLDVHAAPPTPLDATG